MFNKSLNDELVNKIHFLHQELNIAKQKIQFLTEQNDCLQYALANLAFLNKEDYAKFLEDYSDTIIAI